jgi:FkbM family methyltransferase
MKSKLRLLFILFKEKFISKAEEYESVHIADTAVKMLKGTARLKIDYDDAWLYALLGKFDRIFDIGANVGHVSMMAKVQDRQKKILLVDPNLKALSTSAMNLIANNFSIHCDYANFCVSDKNGDQIKFWTLDTDAAGSMFKSHAHTAGSLNSFRMVETVTVDSLIDRVGWIPDFIKVDVEGAESLVLQGAERIGKESKAFIMVEMHATAELGMVDNARKVMDWCVKYSYQPWYMSTSALLEIPETLKDRGRCHLLLLPAGQQYPDYLKSIKQGNKLGMS